MRQFLKSKRFVTFALAVLCVVILGACWFVSQDRTEDFQPDTSPSSSTTSDWSDGGSENRDDSDGADAYVSGLFPSSKEEYPKVTSETEDEVMINFTDTDKSEKTPPPVPEGKTEIENPGEDHEIHPDPSVSEVTPLPDKQSDGNDPIPGSSNGNGAVYDPVFGWIVPSQGEQTIGDSDGDLNKQVGNMG